MLTFAKKVPTTEKANRKKNRTKFRCVYARVPGFRKNIGNPHAKVPGFRKKIGNPYADRTNIGLVSETCLAEFVWTLGPFCMGCVLGPVLS